MLLFPTTTTQHRTKTAMAPSSRNSALSSAWTGEEASDRPRRSGTSTTSSSAAKPTPVPHPQEPNIYNFPMGIAPEYRPLPLLVKLLLGTISFSIASGATPTSSKWNLLQKSGPLEWLVQWARSTTFILGWKRWVGFILRTVLLYVLAAGSLTEALPRFRPSRLSTPDLVANYFLPSPLSHYDHVVVVSENSDNDNDTPVDDAAGRVHWIEYSAVLTGSTVRTDSSSHPPPPPPPPQPLDAVYLNHGFGASCLSWLPVVPSLAQRCRVPLVLGHDAPGFGFTDRPFETFKYSLQSSAVLGSRLLKQRLGIYHNNNNSSNNNNNNNVDQEPLRTVLLMGHSMGSLTTLRMALLMDPAIQQHIILVSPALGLSKSKGSMNQQKSDKQCSPWRKAAMQPLQFLLALVGAYTLRRVVGRRHAWRQGLRAVWGDPRRLRDCDVLRFQWPSVARGWERGLLRFTQSRFQNDDNDDENETVGTDAQLLHQVLSLPNVRSVDVIVSTKDRVVPLQTIMALLKDFPAVKLVQLDGLGHDPFEEDVSAFMNAVDKILQKYV